MAFMNQETKLILALIQTENLVKLLDSNEYHAFFYSHLISIETEIKRQILLTKHQQTSKIKE
jgi:hypothetical protein